MGEDLFRSDTPCKENSINNDYGTKVEFGTLGVNGITCSMEPDKNSLAMTYCTLTEEPNQDRSGVNRQGEFEGAVLVSDENQYVEPQAQLEVEFNSTNEDYSYVGFPHVIGSLDPLQQLHQLDNETCHVQENKSEDSKLNPQREAQKKILRSKDKSTENTKKKLANPTKKITHTSLPRASKPALASPSISASKL
ncbi:hypothetical protein IFM89_013310 [Coptis chinensis]|uniref:Uncharacterized protein n=1 Tax=Coptis chinensis TaxID=261450 RepID=A0A835HEP6_9MAGN|nr:hypothetical protein IFM89_013310 [Coptis chinensis]